MNSQTEKIQLKGAAGAIEVLRDAAAAGSPALGVAVIAHPHPLFGGTMDNKVVQTLARAFVACGWTAVRFNFRGVGASEGVHDEGRGEHEDMLAVIEQLAPEGPLAIAGFSFGAFVASRAAEKLWATSGHPAPGAGRHGRFAIFRGGIAARGARTHAGRARRARRHRAALCRDGLGAAAVTSCHSRSRGRPFLSRTIAAAQKSGRPPPARGLVFRLFASP